MPSKTAYSDKLSRSTGVTTIVKLVVLFVIYSTFGVLYAPNTQAASNVKGLALSPIRTEIDADPGEAVKKVFQVTNYSDQAIHVDLNTEEFNVTNQQYDYAFTTGTNIAQWVQYNKKSLDLAPGRSESVPYTVNIPINAEPRGYYISIFATNSVNDNPGKIQTRQRVASLIYLTVKGNVTRIGSLQSLYHPFLFDGYDKWKMVIANDGTSHYRSRYEASIYNIFDGRQIATLSGSTLVLPHTKREVIEQMPIPTYIGIYRVAYTIGLGDTPAVKRDDYIVFLPKQMYVPLITVTAIVIGGVSYMVYLWLRRNKKD